MDTQSNYGIKGIENNIKNINRIVKIDQRIKAIVWTFIIFVMLSGLTLASYGFIMFIESLL